MRKKTLMLAAPMLAAALILAGCGGENGDATSGETSSQHNDQDVAFATDMIPHHAQAVQMAEMADDRADNQEVQDLAADIEAAQGPEIERMTKWLEAWGEDVPDTGMMGSGDDMEHDDMGDDTAGMPGMMSQEDMDQLGQASGSAFDQMFLTMMIAHHEGAIEMAKTEQAEGENADAMALAEDIEAAQTTEIATMRDLLGEF